MAAKYGLPTCFSTFSLQVVFNSSRLTSQESKSRCKWVGRLDMLTHHTQTCPYVLVDCPFKVLTSMWRWSCCCGYHCINHECVLKTPTASRQGCNAKVERQHLEKHREVCEFRTVTCSYCNVQVEQRGLSKHHDQCALFPLTCSTCLEHGIARCIMKAHIIDKFSIAIVLCPYHGCIACVPRSKLNVRCCSSCLSENTILAWFLVSHLILL